MVRSLIYVAVATLVVLSVRPAGAQPPPVPLVWEVVGDSVGRRLADSEGLFVAPDSAVYTIGLEILAVIRPGDPDWTVIIEDVRLPSRDVLIASTGVMFIVEKTLHRSDDGGRAWTWTGVDDVDVVFETPDGTLVANETDCCGIARSTDGGLSWDLVDLNGTMGFPYVPKAFEHLPASAERPSGRLVAVGRGGAAYSDDGGLTWSPSNLAADFVWDSDHDSVVRSPVTGRLYAAIYGPAPDGGDPWGTIWESADGATWTYAGRIPSVRSTKPLQLKVAPDGVLWALDEGDPRTAWVWRSADQGRTWGRSERIDAVSLVGHELNYEELAVGPEGRLWLGAQRPPGYYDYGAVLRTTEPVIAVSSSPAAPAPGGLGVSVFPNPTASGARVALRLASPERVRVTVVDALGREVAVVHDGPASDDARYDVSTAGLPVGRYTVLATTASGSRVSAGLTVAR